MKISEERSYTQGLREVDGEKNTRGFNLANLLPLPTEQVKTKAQKKHPKKLRGHVKRE